MANNATWTIIDRGEPESYFAIWDLVDYIGQGVMLKEECKLLREVWEEMALANSANFAEDGDSRNALLDIVMKNYDVKQTMYNFVQALIFCLVPKKGHLFDAELAKNFEMVVKAGRTVTSRTGGIFDLSSFINKGAAKAAKEQEAEAAKAAKEHAETAKAAKEQAVLEEAKDEDEDEADVTMEDGKGNEDEDEGQPRKRARTVAFGSSETVKSQPSSFELKFDLVPGNEGYNLATRILNATTNVEWQNHFSYFTDTFTASIIDKGMYLTALLEKSSYNLVQPLIPCLM